MINKEFVENKIKLIEDELVNLEKLAKYSFQEIVSDFMKQNTVERILEKIIIRAIDINQHLIAEMAVKETELPLDYKNTFLTLVEFNVYSKEFAVNISKSVGARNALVHEYDEIDYSKIYSSISDCLKDYEQYCEYILNFLEKNN